MIPSDIDHFELAELEPYLEQLRRCTLRAALDADVRADLLLPAALN